MSVVAYSFQGPKKPVTQERRSRLIFIDEEQSSSGNQFVSWIPGLYGPKTVEVTKLPEEDDPEQKAWVALSRKAMARWLRENS